jgi:ABC-type multidrug transport system fused ATPase/permease subunit
MVRDADRIWLVERGRIVESGSWDELVTCNTGRFRELCAAQGLLGTTAMPSL